MIVKQDKDYVKLSSFYKQFHALKNLTIDTEISVGRYDCIFPVINTRYKHNNATVYVRYDKKELILTAYGDIEVTYIKSRNDSRHKVHDLFVPLYTDPVVTEWDE